MAFLSGKISAKELINREYRLPIAREVRQEMKVVADEVAKKLQNTTTGWSESPKFTPKVSGEIANSKTAQIVATFTMKGSKKAIQKWKWVDEGTAVRGGKGGPYLIKSKRINPRSRQPYRLPIQKYSPRTKPGRGLPKSTGPGKKYGDVRYFQSVMHTGIAPRKFTERIVESLRGTGKTSAHSRISRAVEQAKRRLKL